jgi:hypothetical protein
MSTALGLAPVLGRELALKPVLERELALKPFLGRAPGSWIVFVIRK